MPRVPLQAEPKRHLLKSLPGEAGEEAGYVVIRPLSYGQALERRQLATRLSMEQQERSGKTKVQTNSKMDIDIMQRASREFEYANCIIEHNIEDPAGKLINFHNPKSIDILPKAVGEEIEDLLDEVNGDEEDDDTDFTLPSTQSSQEAPDESLTH